MTRAGNGPRGEADENECPRFGSGPNALGSSRFRRRHSESRTSDPDKDRGLLERASRESLRNDTARQKGKAPAAGAGRESGPAARERAGVPGARFVRAGVEGWGRASAE